MSTTHSSKKQPASAAASSGSFFDWMRSLGLQREPGWIGGVAAGIAARIGIDVVIVRGILVVLAVLGAPLLLAYAAAWLLLPDTEGRIPLEQAVKGQPEPAIAGIVIMAILGLLPVAPAYWFGGLWSSYVWTVEVWPSEGWLVFARIAWTLIILGAIAFFIILIARKDMVNSGSTLSGAPPRPPAGAPDSEFAEWRAQQAAWRAENEAFRRDEAAARAAGWKANRERVISEQSDAVRRSIENNRASRPNVLFSILVIGLALVAGGATYLVVGGGTVDSPSVVTALAVALAVLALGVIINGVLGKRAGGASGVAWLILIPLVFLAAIPQLTHVDLVGGASFAPKDVPGDVPDFYFVGSGNVVIDLRDYYENTMHPGDSDVVYLFIGSGNVTVLLPPEDIIISSEIGSGTTQYVAGNGSTTTLTDGKFVRNADPLENELQVRIFVGAGDINIKREKI